MTLCVPNVSESIMNVAEDADDLTIYIEIPTGEFNLRLF